MTSRRADFRKIRKTLETLESRRLLSMSPLVEPAKVDDLIVAPAVTMDAAVTNTSIVGYRAAQIRKAYGITGTGAGQTIAIVDAYKNPNIAADLKVFDKAMGLSDPTLTIIGQTGVSPLASTNVDWGLEIALDVEWAHVAAPSANILLVEANSSSMTDLLAAVNVARKYVGVSVVSMSWGTGEFSNERSFDSYFTTPANHQAVTFVAASGDDGIVTWPAVSPNVLSVGGTALTLASTAGAYGSETGGSSSGGGYSRYETEPIFQFNVQSSGRRSSPDVAYDASNSTGFAVYDSLTVGGQSGWFNVGGTSAGAPQWAGIIAIADQARVSKGAFTLGTNAVLTALYATRSSATTYATDFHDVMTGSSGGRNRRFAGTGYDLLTGLGTPKAAGVVATLASATSTGSITSAIASASAVSAKATAAVVASPASAANVASGSVDESLNELDRAVGNAPAWSNQAIRFDGAEGVASATGFSVSIPLVTGAEFHFTTAASLAAEEGEVLELATTVTPSAILNSDGGFTAFSSVSDDTPTLDGAWSLLWLTEHADAAMDTPNDAMAPVVHHTTEVSEDVLNREAAPMWELFGGACLVGAVAAYWMTDARRWAQHSVEPIARPLFCELLVTPS
jgi:hypothetical protein